MAVLVVTETQDIDLAGILHDYYEITFTVGAHPGSFTARVPKTGDAVADAAAALDAINAQVNAIYGL